jgi:hypothetical protein
VQIGQHRVGNLYLERRDHRRIVARRQRVPPG